MAKKKIIKKEKIVIQNKEIDLTDQPIVDVIAELENILDTVTKPVDIKLSEDVLSNYAIDDLIKRIKAKWNKN